MEGSIRRAGDRLRITARLAETASGHSVWAERYDRRMEDVFAIQDEIAQSIALALRVVLTDKEKSEIEKVPTSNIQAYDYYLRGRKFLYQLRSPSLEFARQMFARAIVIDPNYARAYAGVADCSSFLYMWFDSSEDNLREALSASRRAVELDPESPVTHASLGLALFLSNDMKPHATNLKPRSGFARNCLKPISITAAPVSPRDNLKKPLSCFAGKPGQPCGLSGAFAPRSVFPRAQS